MSLFVTASAGSGKTFRLTREVRRHLERDGDLVVAATFTRAAAAEMEKRILETVENGNESATEKLRLLMRASRVHFSTIDALFHRFLSTEAYLPQVADDHEQALITAAADERFFQDPRVLAEVDRIVIAARILHIQPDGLIKELDKEGDALAAWNCPADLIDTLIGAQARIAAKYGLLQDRVRDVAGEVRGALRSQVAIPLLEPITEIDLGKALFLKSDMAEVRVAAADRQSSAYAVLKEVYPPMRRLAAEHLLNTARLRSALLKYFSSLRAELLCAEKERLGRLYFADIPDRLLALDGPASPDRPHFMARLYELGFHRTAHLLLDEFQDTSRPQFDLLRPLIEEILGSVGDDAEGERSLFLVGDWKQSIYQWREAAPEYLRRSIAPYLASGQLAAETLPHNYRSTPLLIGFFNHLVAELFSGTAKTNLQTPPLTKRHPYGGVSEVTLIPAACRSGDDPAYERLVRTVQEKKAASGCPWGGMAVLCRTNTHMDKIAAALTRAAIPTSGIRGRELLSLREGAALWLSLISVFTEHDSRFIPQSLAALGYGEGLSAAIADSTEAMDKSPRPHRFTALCAALHRMTPLFPRVLIETLWNEAERYFKTPSAVDAADFLGYVLRMSHLITAPEGEHADRVKLATIHSAKGLEFPHVFLFWKEGSERLPRIPHPDDGCPLCLSKVETAFLATGPLSAGAAIAGAVQASQEEKAEETANLLYVAVTRAAQSLTIVLPADKEGDLKGFSERMHRAAQTPIPGAERAEFGWRRDYGPEAPRQDDAEELIAPDREEFPTVPDSDEESDPALRSADIEAGIERGIRIHECLAGLTGGRQMAAPTALSEEERIAVERFLGSAEVREILFRPGKVLTEQHLSDTRSFGIADRLVIASDRITLVDFKTGRVGHLADKYRLQMIRYRTILQNLFNDRRIECYLLFVDEPQRIVTV